MTHYVTGPVTEVGAVERISGRTSALKNPYFYVAEIWPSPFRGMQCGLQAGDQQQQGNPPLLVRIKLPAGYHHYASSGSFQAFRCGSSRTAELSLRDGKFQYSAFISSSNTEILANNQLNQTEAPCAITVISVIRVNVTMKFYESNYDYNYAFPAVTLAYFLRYPNPYSKHVLSTDVLERHFDPDTKRLHTLRLHLKRSKVPAGILKFLPRGLAGPGGASQSFVLEKSIIDIKEGWMETESKNLEWTGILSVVEKQSYKTLEVNNLEDVGGHKGKDWTHCKTVVTFKSKLGQSMALAKRKSDSTTQGDEEAPRQGFFAALSTAGIQRTVELLGVKRTKSALVNGKAGMNVVLERLRNGGVVGVLEGMRRDRMEAMGGEVGGSWKQVWTNGQRNHDDDD